MAEPHAGTTGRMSVDCHGIGSTQRKRNSGSTGRATVDVLDGQDKAGSTGRGTVATV